MRICDAGKRAKFWQAGHRPGNVPGLPCGRAPGADVSPVVLTIDAGQLGKLVIDLARAGPPAAVPVLPTIDAGQFQGQADGGQGGHRPGKRRAFPRPCLCCRRSTPASSKGKPTAGNSARRSSIWQRAARGADDRRRQAGHRAARGADDRRREADGGQGGHRAARGADVPACRRSTAGKRAESGARRSST